MPESGPEKFTADKLPNIWLLDSKFLLKELARIRELALLVPTNTTNPLELRGPANTVVNALWDLEQDMRYCLLLKSEMQASFANKAEDLKGEKPNRRKTHRLLKLPVSPSGSQETIASPS